MSLLRFLLREARADRGVLVAGYLVAILTYGLISLRFGEAVGAEADAGGFFAFLVLAVLFLLGWRAGTSRTNVVIERALGAVRLRVLGGLRRLRLPELEAIGRGEIRDNLALDARVIASGSTLVMRALQNAWGILANLVILAFVSVHALLIVGGTLLVVAVPFALAQARVRAAQRREDAHAAAFHAAFRELVRGLKEIKLHRARGDAFVAALDADATAAEAARVAAGTAFYTNAVIQTLVLLTAAAVCVFAVPLLAPAERETAVIAAMMAAFVPVSAMRELPVLFRADAAARRLERLEAAVAAAAAAAPAAPPPAPAAAFRRLALAEVTFAYPDMGGEPGFAVGPLSLAIPAGTVTFVVGGNGSGKSTLLRLLTGLYAPRTGRILLDGAPVADMSRHGGSLFSAIFADHHLFDRLYGMGEVDDAEVNRMLERMQVAGKTRCEAGRLTTTDLSTGQAKRVALALALVLRRPLLVLDEWTADQDPEFRALFYQELLPELRAAGRTVVAVTHDDRWFAVADRLVRLEDGRIVADGPPPRRP